MKRRTEFPVLPEGYRYMAGPMTKFVRSYPYLARNVFIMMPFSAPGSDPLYATIDTEISDHGLVPIRADARSVSDFVWANVVAHMLGCSYGVAVFEPSGGIDFNPNVSIEAGFMLALDKPVLLLINESLTKLPVDLTGRNVKTYSPYSLESSVRDAIRDWVERDISYYDYGDRKLVVFVSRGGTCRCAMAKALLSKLLDDQRITGVAVDAAAIADPHKPAISKSAVHAVADLGAGRWLEGHRPRKMSKYLQDRADLIIKLTDVTLTRANPRPEKEVSDRELFGEKIPNPWPDTEDDAALGRYKYSCELLWRDLQSALPEILARLGLSLVLPDADC